MIFNTSKVPLLIDPNTQATTWLKRNNPKLESLNQQDVKFANTLELALRFGKELLIQELDNIEAILIPLLRRDLVQQAARSTVQVGDKQIDYNPSFKLLLCTRNSGIDLPSNTRGLVSVINYSVTKSGLESKLLSIIINHEKPELEEKKIHLLEEEEKLKVSLDGLEKKLL
jgi:dynein heavy chain 2